LIEADRRIDQVRAPKRELPNDVRRNVGVALFGEVAVGGAPDESSISGRFEPSARFTRGGNLNRLLRLLRLLLATRSASASASMPPPVAPIVKAAVPSFVSITLPLVLAAPTTALWRLTGAARAAARP
jgi:hypothetical protein